jgi:hypothetical protein
MQLSGSRMTANSVRAVGFVAVGLMLGLALNEHYSVSAQPTPPPFARGFYLTTSEHNGANALTACTRGFHMASLWEVFDPTNLEYDTTLGTTDQDSGSGPPSDLIGWIRTGTQAGNTGGPGDANCNAWSSSAVGDSGTTVRLSEEWNIDLVGSIQPWQGIEISCNQPAKVWCVEDR